MYEQILKVSEKFKQKKVGREIFKYISLKRMYN